MFTPSFPKNQQLNIALRSLLLYVLCEGAYFFYDKTINAGNETRQLGIAPYVIITVWFVWIFFHNAVLIRKLAFKKKILFYILSLVAGLVITGFVQIWLLRAIRGVNNPLPTTVVTITFYTFIGALVFLAFEYLKERRDFYQTKSLKKEIELQQLKNQLNPHFLFNSLNTIYSYNMENNTVGNDLILKLSQLMRFMVESTRTDTIPLREEVGFIENYIAFERERLGYRCDISYQNTVKILDKQVPPLILFPFIENAFKHGTNTVRPSRIAIILESSDDNLLLSVGNEIIDKDRPSTKVGLSNVGRRLELLFPERHELTITEEGNQYSINLKLNLQ